MIRNLQRSGPIPAPSGDGPDAAVVGSDILSLLSSGMYVDPLTLYREYVQNSADSIEAAQIGGLVSNGDGRVDIQIDRSARSIRIRDNGEGVPQSLFVRTLCSVGASGKRGTRARGFRGVGRLSGLGYCQELIFRSRAAGELSVSELSWDCRQMKSRLRDQAQTVDLASLLGHIVAVREVSAEGFPDHFFEVELRGVIRLRTDALMSPEAVAEYLGEVGPVPFHPDFRLGQEIAFQLQQRSQTDEIAIFVEGVQGQVYRPHRDSLEAGKRAIRFEDVEFLSIPSVDGAEAAFGWILHHEYEGAVPSAFAFKGMRLRSGNIQVGSHSLLEELFPEARFNSWTVGEVHIVDPRVLPNARRDGFELNAHFLNLQNQIAPAAREVARRCRTSSVRRNLLREFGRLHDLVAESLGILDQGSLAGTGRDQIALGAERSLLQMQKLADKEMLRHDNPTALQAQIEDLRQRLAEAMGEVSASVSPLFRLPADKQVMYHHLFELVYESSVNRVAAKALIDRILLRVCEPEKEASEE